MAGAELAFDGMEVGDGLREGREKPSVEEGEVAAGEHIEGSDTHLVKGGSWSLQTLLLPPAGGWQELWSEQEDRLSMLRAGEQEEG